MFFYIIKVSVANAFILFMIKSSNSKAQLNLKQFRFSVALGMLGAGQTDTKLGRPTTSTLNYFKRTVAYAIQFDSCAYMPQHIDKLGRCTLCIS